MNEFDKAYEPRDERADERRLLAEKEQAERSFHRSRLSEAAATVAVGMGACASRVNARAALLDRAQQLRRQADGLESLAGVLPADLGYMSKGAEEALWQLVIDARR